MSNNALLLLAGIVFFCWGLIEYLVGKAYVRTGWQWTFGQITKEDNPGRYWSSVALKSIAGLVMLIVLLYRQSQGIL
jgi:hypothetical protein